MGAGFAVRGGLRMCMMKLPRIYYNYDGLSVS